MHQWTKKEVTAIRRLAQEGMTMKEIGEQFGVSRAAIAGVGKRFRIRFKGNGGRLIGSVYKKWTAEEIGSMVFLAKEGFTAKQMGAIFERTPEAVEHAASRHNIKFKELRAA